MADEETKTTTNGAPQGEETKVCVVSVQLFVAKLSICVLTLQIVHHRRRLPPQSSVLHPPLVLEQALVASQVSWPRPRMVAMKKERKPLLRKSALPSSSLLCSSKRSLSALAKRKNNRCSTSTSIFTSFMFFLLFSVHTYTSHYRPHSLYAANASSIDSTMRAANGRNVVSVKPSSSGTKNHLASVS